MIPFRRGSSRYAASPEPETPYQRAGQLWDERIGSARVQARNWRLMAFGCLTLAAGSTAALGWQGSRASITPWVVQVDRTGRAEAVGPAAGGYRPSDPEVAAQLAQLIEDVRSLPSDPVVLRQQWLRAYQHARGEGALALNDYARGADPFSRLGREQVAVQVTSVVRASPDSFRVEWTESHYAAGGLTGSEHWTAILTTELDPPKDPEGLRRNPLGVFVTQLNWTKELA
jgi:type IV secretory pathway TrbF-like protein